MQDTNASRRLAMLCATPLFAASTIAQCTEVWRTVAPALPSPTVSAAVLWDPDGPGPAPVGVVVGGNFSSIGAMAVEDVALLDLGSGTWSALPGMPVNAITRVVSLAVLPDGSLVAGGTFFGAGSGANFLARWDGATWNAFGGGVDNSVFKLLPLANGDLLVGGSFTVAGGTPALGIARWNGTGWSALPGLQAPGFPGFFVAALTSTANGDVHAGGLFTCPGGFNLARWDGSAWSGIGALPQFALSLLTTRDDEVLVGRQGTMWRVVGAGLQSVGHAGGDVSGLLELPDGDVLALGYFLGAVPTPSTVTRWRDGSWHGLGAPVAQALGAITLPGGDVLVFGHAGASLGTMARLSTTCPSGVSPYGVGCSGSGGLNQLDATSAPWIGSTFRARATGMPATAVVLSVYGFAQLSIPFASVLPEALPGCTILMTGDLIEVVSPSAGVAETAIVLPDAPALVGGVFHHYVVPLEIDAALQLGAVTNSNALTCTVGAF